jgi:hypothetical protein
LRDDGRGPGIPSSLAAAALAPPHRAFPRHRAQVRAEKRAWHAANKDRVNAERRAQYAEDPSRKLRQREYIAANGRKIMLKHYYGMTLADYDALLERQNGVCAICESTDSDRPLYVDHCHVRNKVRGLLCRSCNLGLGNFKDDPQRLRAATAYLEFHCEAVGSS